MIKYYLQITKPKIIFSNLVSVISGFLLANKNQQIDFGLLINLITSMIIIIASSCVWNNLIDSNIDKKMKRTENRALVCGHIKSKHCHIYAIILSILGFSLLFKTTNLLTINLTILGFFIYVVVYSYYMKPKTIYSTIVGSISGAIPPITGYCTISNNFNNTALILLIIFSIWQIPHFYSITILYAKDYQTALIPTFLEKYGMQKTKHYINACIIIFIIITSLLTIMNYTSYIFFFTTELMNIYWLFIAFKGYSYTSKTDNISWAKKIFLHSIIVITTLNIMMSIDSIII